MAETVGENRKDAGHGGQKRIGSGEKVSRCERDEQRGFVHALWLLVVLSAFLFGVSVVNVGIGIKIYEALSKQSTAIEKLTLSVREIQKSVLHLSEALEETDQAEEGDSERPMDEGRI